MNNMNNDNDAKNVLIENTSNYANFGMSQSKHKYL